jgi:hypothetical protein
VYVCVSTTISCSVWLINTRLEALLVHTAISVTAQVGVIDVANNRLEENGRGKVK